MITALGLFALTGGIYLYTLKSIQRDDDFSDVPVPPISDENLDKLKREYEQEKK
jgi:cytochrome c oxidase assembly factor 3